MVLKFGGVLPIGSRNQSEVVINIDSVGVGVTVNGNNTNPEGIVINPDSILNSIVKQPKDVSSSISSNLSWVIYDDNNNVVLSGIRANVDMNKVNELQDGRYRIETSVVGETKYGSPLTDTRDDSFILKRSQPTVEVDKPLNPEEITITQKFLESELKWEITDKDNNIVLEGTGLTLSIWNEIRDMILEDGEYKIRVAETSLEGRTSIDETQFQVKKMLV